MAPVDRFVYFYGFRQHKNKSDKEIQMLIAIALAVALIASTADVLLIKKEKKTKNIVKTVFRDTVMIVLTGFGIVKFFINSTDIFGIQSVSDGYTTKFIIAYLISAIIWLGSAFLCEKAPCFEKATLKHKKSNRAIKIICAVLYTLGIVALTATIWGKDFFGDLTPDQIIINLNSPTEGTDVGVYISGVENVVLLSSLLAGYFCIFCFSDYKLVIKKSDKSISIFHITVRRTLSCILAVFLFFGGCIYGIEEFSLIDLYSAYARPGEFIEENFADPNTVNMQFPEKKRNLIHIYLESMENTFLSKDLGGFCEDNLIPHLYGLLSEGVSFSHRADTPGGFRESTGAGWSVSSMVNMGTGLPMKVPDKPNQYGGADNFLPGATAIGDILKEQGYEQTVMFGANADFGGLTYYFQSHGDYTIIDYKEAKKRGYIPQDYYVFWGYEDDKLYEYAKEELTRLADTGKPFHFMMETADTHTPEGYLSADAPTPYESKYANAVRYSQEQTYNFIRWIQQQPFYENTTLVIIGDHLSMAKTFFEGLDGIEKYDRSCYNLILNPADDLGELPKDRQFNRDWAVFDMFPTILASIGVKIEGDRLGIGTNLFSDTDTVFEQYGTDYVNDELVKRSDFYNINILKQSYGETESTSVSSTVSE